jgi:hypothetical protein
MGGQIFKNSRELNDLEYNKELELNLSELALENVKVPLRLQSKKIYNDIDLIVAIPELLLVETKHKHEIIFVAEKRLQNSSYEHTFSMHLLNNDVQVDLLPAINPELTQVYYSYECANVFFKKLVKAWNRNAKMTSFGVLLTSKKLLDSMNLQDSDYCFLKHNEYIITSVKVLFEIIGCSSEEFFRGFRDEFELLEYFKKSLLYPCIYWNNNSSLDHDLGRMETFRNLKEHINIINN